MSDAGLLFGFQIAAIAVLAAFWVAAGRYLPSAAVTAAEPEAQRRRYAFLAMGAIALTAAHFAALAIRKHELFLTFGYDLGTMDQTIWNTAHGRWLQYSSPEGPIVTRPLAGRIELVYLPLALIYRLVPGPQTLLAVQALALAFSGWPAFLLVRHVCGSSPLALAVTVNYLLHPGLRGTNLHAFHASALAVPFMVCACYQVERGKWRETFGFSLLALACREELGVFAAGLGVFVWIRHRQPRWGAALLSSGVLWMVFAWMMLPRMGSATGWLAPGGGEGNPMLGRLAHGPIGLVRHYLQSPGAIPGDLLTVDNLYYLATLLGPSGFLALLAPGAFFMAAPVLAIYLLSGWVEMTQVGTHYSANVLPVILFAGALGGARLVSQAARARTPMIGLLLTLGLFYAWFPPTRMKLVQEPFWSPEHLRSLRYAIQLPPTEASVLADQHMLPHLTQRRRAYAWVTKQDTDWVVYDGLEPVLWRGFLTPKNPRKPELIEMLRPDSKRTPVWFEDGVIAFRRLNPQSNERIMPIYHPAVTYRSGSLTQNPRPLFVGREGQELRNLTTQQYPVRHGVMVPIHLCWSIGSLPDHSTIVAIIVDCEERRWVFRRTLDRRVACDQFLLHLPQAMVGRQCRIGLGQLGEKHRNREVSRKDVTGTKWVGSMTVGRRDAESAS